MLRAMFRVLAGFIFACLAAGAATVAFVITPAELAASSSQVLPDRLASFGMLALLAATHSAIFAAPFALIAALVGEWQSLRSPIYYLTAGVLIAMAGFAAQYSSETGAAASIANNYAIKAFLTAGFVGGLAYWMLAGRMAGGEPDSANKTPPPAKSDAKSSGGKGSGGRSSGGAEGTPTKAQATPIPPPVPNTV